MLRSRASLVSLLIGSTLVFSGVLVADQILETYSASLTTYLPTGKTKVQNVRPRAEQRGVNLDGSMRAAPGIPAAIAGNPFENVWGGTTALEGVNLDTGSYHPFEIDISLPAAGHRWQIGRSYSARQDDGGQFDSQGPQGANWMQTSQPELKLYNPNNNATDVLYLVYGADRYVEFNRAGASSNDYKSKNGAAGAFTKAGGSPDVWTYTGPDGTKIDFFGGNTASNKADWQLWRITDADANVSYVGHPTSATLAITNASPPYSGFDAGGRIERAYDSANRRYLYIYTTRDGVVRLDQVKAERLTSGTWASSPTTAMVQQVDYTYYSSESYGDPGDLKTVTITTPTSQSNVNQVRTKYYRYWEGPWDGSSQWGVAHEIMLVLDYEGARNFDWTETDMGEPTFDAGYLTASTGTLEPFAIAYFEYDTSNRITLAQFNGSCGCGGGGANGTTLFSYGTNGNFSEGGGYDQEWARRTVVVRADSTYLTQYFDETGQALSQIITNTNPASSPTQTWVTNASRDTMGCVVEIDTPASITGYTHNDGFGNPDGTITVSSTVGLIRTYTRAASTDVKSFVTDEKFKTGTSNPAYLEHSWTHDYTTATKTLTDVTIARPLIASDRVYSDPVTSGTSGSYLTSYTYTSYGGGTPLAIETVETTHPTVSTGTNGSNSADSSSVHLRKDGLVDFAKSEDGEIAYTAYTNGQVTTRVQDADTTSLSPPSVDFESVATPPDRAELTTTSTYDDQGRLRTRTLPTSRREQWTHAVLADRRIETLHYPHSTGGGDLYGPASLEVDNLAGKPVETAIVVINGGVAAAYNPDYEVDETKFDSIEATDVGTLTQASITTYDESGSHQIGQYGYHVMPGTWIASTIADYDLNSMSQDDMGRVIRSVDATGTISRTVYDTLGRAKEHWIGTNDYGLTGGSLSGPSNMVKIEQLEFDGNASGGNSYLTKRTEYIEGTTTGQRVTNYTNDVRGNVLLVDNPTGPDQLTQYDNMKRPTSTGQYTATTAPNDPTSTPTNRLALSETMYDERGRVWKRVRHNIDLSDGSDDDSIDSLAWYDSTGKVIKTDGEQLTKTAYDTAGRAVVQYVLASTNDSVYADASTVTGDVVLGQLETAYDSGGRVVVQASIDRYHTDLSTPTGTLDTDTNPPTPTEFVLAGSPDVIGRIQISAMWYDNRDRSFKAANYGTNGGADFVYDPVPANSPDHTDDDILVTESTFNDDGTLLSVTDPKGLVTRYEYDEAGRRNKVISNYVNGTPSSPTADDDQIVQYGYTKGLQTSITAYVDGSTGDQVTTYFYGTSAGTPGAMKISTGHLLRAVKYPDSINTGTTLANIESDSKDVVLFAYNAQGQLTWKKDQYVSTPSAAGGNVIEMTYDDAGRETSRAVTTVGTGFDGEVERIQTAYTALGQVNTVTQFDDPAAGDELDEVKYVYDGWGNVTNFRQDKDDVVVSSGDFEVSYAYANINATAGRNTIRRTSETIGGKTFTLNYASSGSPDVPDVSSRVHSIKDGGTTLVQYDYVGAGQVVGTTYDEPDVFSRQYGASAGDYADLDRFNRATTSKWTKDLSTDVDFYRYALEYDRNSNILTADEADDSNAGGGNDGHVGFDVAYSMDNLNRLKDADEGTLVSGGSITSRTRRQQWDLNQTGGWVEDYLDLDGDGSWSDPGEWDDKKTFNTVNEVLTRDLDDTTGTTGNNYSLTYDLAGNLTNDATDYQYEWDAFYRLRKVKTLGGALVAEYRYNGLGYRIGVLQDTNASGTALTDGSDLWYYSAYDENWRMVATYRDSDTNTNPKERYVHQQAGDSGYGGSSYIDLVAFRERDANTAWTTASDGVLEERLYYCQNQHADVVALATAAGGQREMDRYSAYGVPFGLPVGDANSSGVANATDRTIIQGWINNGDYDVRADYDLNGAITSADKTAIQNLGAVALGHGGLSSAAVRNHRGQAGHMQGVGENHEQVARARQVDSGLGVWTSRDTGEYGYPGSLYQLCALRPLVLVDPDGRAPQDSDELTASDKLAAYGQGAGAYFQSHMAGMFRNGAKWDGSVFNGYEHCYASCLSTLTLGPRKAKRFWDDHELNDKSNYIKGKPASDPNDSGTWGIATINTITPEKKIKLGHANRMGFDLINNNIGRQCGLVILGLICEYPPQAEPPYGSGADADRCWRCCRKRVDRLFALPKGPQWGETNRDEMMGPCGGGTGTRPALSTSASCGLSSSR